jgi:carbohydrate kinase (thermoresistant glucokinase family)
VTIDETPAHPVLVIMGVAGSGKSTVAQELVSRLGWDFVEGDDLHPPANRAKMAAGEPLTDDDRQPWLETVADWIRGQIEAGRPGIVTCSALRHRYRDLLRTDATVFVHLHGSRELLAERMGARKDHFMPSSLLESQLATLEPLRPDERAVVVDIGPPAEAQVQEIIDRLALVPDTTDRPVPDLGE